LLDSVCVEHKWMKKKAAFPSKYSIFLTETRQDGDRVEDSLEKEQMEQEESAYSQLPEDWEESSKRKITDPPDTEGGGEESIPVGEQPTQLATRGEAEKKEACGATAKSFMPNLGRLYAISGKNGATL